MSNWLQFLDTFPNLSELNRNEMDFVTIGYCGKNDSQANETNQASSSNVRYNSIVKK